MTNSNLEGRISSVLHAVDDATSRAGAAALVAAILAVFATSLAIADFPGNWEVSFATVSSCVTLIMLFVIQHTQSRHQIALQLKLDELIRASPAADDHLVHIEVAQESELHEREQGQIAHHERVRGPSEVHTDPH